MVTELGQGLYCWLTASFFVPVEDALKNELVTTAQPGGSGCYAVGKKHLRFGRHCCIAIRP